jgi:hypothetical protein
MTHTKDEALHRALEALLINCGGNTEGIGKEAITAIKQALAAPTVQEPCGRLESDPDEGHIFVPRIEGDWSMLGEDLYTTPPAAQPAPVPLTARELELIDGMIEVQLDHAKRCDSIANRTMAERQKGWDMERVALLQKLKEKSI